MPIRIGLDRFAAERHYIQRVTAGYESNGTFDVGREVKPFHLDCVAGLSARRLDHQIRDGGFCCGEIYQLWAGNVQRRIDDRFLLVVGDKIRFCESAGYTGQAFLASFTAQFFEIDLGHVKAVGVHKEPKQYSQSDLNGFPRG